MLPLKVIHKIRFYDRRGSNVGVSVLKNAKWEELVSLFSLSESGLLCESIPITSKESFYFEREFDMRFDFSQFEYFLDCDQAD
ncbi:MAG: hypothetical protein NT027_09905 [Proteobacteria bacterium]|nr:hypothetical protein [Pseudomonadota bacterium]